VLGLIRARVLPLLEEEALLASEKHEHWLLEVAVDRELLELSAFSISGAAQGYLRRAVGAHLLRFLWALERHSALETYLEGFDLDSEAMRAFARQAILSGPLVDRTSALMPPVLEVESVVRGLRFPFSQRLYGALADEQRIFEEELQQLSMGNGCEGDDAWRTEALIALRTRTGQQVLVRLQQVLGPLAQSGLELMRGEEWFIHDVLLLYSSEVAGGETTPRLQNLLRDLLAGLGVAQQPEAVVVLLWEKAALLRALSVLLGHMADGPAALAAAQEAEAEAETAEGRDLLAGLTCRLAQSAVMEQLARCCHDWDNVRGWVPQLEETLRLVQGALGAAKLKLNHRLARGELGLALFEGFFVLKIVGDLATVLELNLPGDLPLLRAGPEALRMDEELLLRAGEWLTAMSAGDSPGRDPASRALASVMERFLFFATETAYAEEEGDGAGLLLRQPLLLAVCRQACRGADEGAAVALSLVLHQVFDEIDNALGTEDETLDGLVLRGSLPVGLRGLLGPVEEALHPAIGTPLEIMALDILEAEYVIGSWDGHRAGDAEAVEDEANNGTGAVAEACEAFEAAISTLLASTEVQGAQEGLLVLWSSHAFVKGFLNRTAKAVVAGTPPANVLDSVNRNLGRIPPGDGARALLHTLRVYLLKALRMGMGDLRAACEEGGHVATLFPWAQQVGWSARTERLLGYNPFRAGGAAGESLDEALDAWDTLHSNFGRAVEPLADLVAAVLEAPNGDARARARAAALAQAVFIRMCVPAERVYEVDTRAREQLARLAGAGDAAVRLLGGVALGCLDGFGAPPGVDPALRALLVSLCVKVASRVVQQPAHVLAAYVFRPEDVLPATFVLAADANEAATLVRLTGGHAIYRCPCGFRYEVDGCGEVTHAGGCPVCHARIVGPA
jgi:hypothetical protein